MPWSGRQTGIGQAFRSGVADSRRFFLPTESKRTVAWARDPSPLALTTMPRPQWSCTTSSPATRPRSSAPVLPRPAGDPGGAVAPSRPGPGGGRQGDGRREDGAGQVLLTRQGVVARAAARRPEAHVLDQVRGHLGDEPAGHGRLGAAPGRARPGVRNGQVLAGPGDPDIEEPALLLELARLGERAEVREDPLLQAHHEDRRILQALGRVQRHQRDAGAVAVQLVGVRHQGHRLEEAEDVVEVGRLGGQLGQVLDPSVRLVGVLRHQLGQVARPLGHQLHEVGRVDRLHQRPQLAQRLGELLRPLQRLAAEARLLGAVDGLAERDVLHLGPGGEPGHGRVADAALGDVDDPAGRHLVVGIGQHAHEGQDVLDLPPVVELGPAHHLVGDAAELHGELEGQALRVGAVEDGEVAPREVVRGVQAQDLAGHPVGLVALVLGPVTRDRAAGVPDREELLGLAADVVGDDGVRRIEDRLGGAEVLLQHDRRHVGEGPFELQDVADVRAAPAVDRLVGVADDADVAVRLAQQLDDLVLGVVRVLELVDEDVPEALLVRGAHVVVGLQQVGRHHEQVVEVQGVGSQQPALVQRVDVGDALAERVRPAAGVLPEGLEVDQLGLGLADDPLHRPRRQPLLVEAELGGDHLDQAARVGVVVDREGGAVAQPVGVGAQDAQAGRVEGRHPHLLGGRPHQLGHPRAHLARRLVGEGDGEDAPRRRVTGGEEVRDAPGQHARLARAGPGNDQERPAAVLHGGALGQGEVVDQRGGPAGEGAGRGGAAPAAAAPVVGHLASGRDVTVGRVVLLGGSVRRRRRRPQRPRAPTSSSVMSNRRACSPLPGVTVTPTQWSRAASTSRRVPPGSRPPLR